MARDAFKTNLIYAVGSLANSAALFILIPYLVRGLSPQEYGLWALTEIVILVLNSAMVAGIDMGVMRVYWAETDPARRARILGTAAIAVAGWGAATYAIGGILLAPLLVPATAASTRWLVLSCAWAEAFWALGLNMLRIQERARSYVIISLGRLVVFVGLAIGLISAGGGVDGGLIGRLAATCLGVAAIAALVRPLTALRPDWPGLRAMLRYGLPLLPSNFALYILAASDRYVLERVATLETVAIYTFAYKIASTVELVVTRPFSIDWASRRFKLANAPDARQQYARVLTVYLACAAGFALMVLALTPAIYRLLAPAAYRGGAAVIPVLLLAYVCAGVAHPLNVGIMIKDRTRWLPVLGWAAAIVCLGLNYWWIPRYGIAGAAWATVAAYAVWSGGIAWISLRVYPVAYSLREQGAVLLLAALGYAGLRLIEQAGLGDLLATGLKCGWIGLLCAGGGYRIWTLARAPYQPAEPYPQP